MVFRWCRVALPGHRVTSCSSGWWYSLQFSIYAYWISVLVTNSSPLTVMNGLNAVPNWYGKTMQNVSCLALSILFVFLTLSKARRIPSELEESFWMQRIGSEENTAATGNFWVRVDKFPFPWEQVGASCFGPDHKNASNMIDIFSSYVNDWNMLKWSTPLPLHMYLKLSDIREGQAFWLEPSICDLSHRLKSLKSAARPTAQQAAAPDFNFDRCALLVFATLPRLTCRSVSGSDSLTCQHVMHASELFWLRRQPLSFFKFYGGMPQHSFFALKSRIGKSQVDASWRQIDCDKWHLVTQNDTES